MDLVETLKCSQYPVLRDIIKKARTVEPLTITMPKLSKPYDDALIRRCQQTIDKGIYLMVLEDMTMFYVEED